MAGKPLAEYVVKLSNEVIMPICGLGLWQVKDKSELNSSLQTAIDIGYRYFDTAYLYSNESDIGNFFSGLFKGRFNALHNQQQD